MYQPIMIFYLTLSVMMPQMKIVGNVTQFLEIVILWRTFESVLLIIKCLREARQQEAQIYNERRSSIGQQKQCYLFLCKVPGVTFYQYSNALLEFKRCF
jgi:hypothetical protein